MMRRSSLAVLVAVLAFSCASPRDPNDLSKMSATYKGEVGESPVGVIPDAVLHDAQRNKDVTTTIEYPTKSAGNPLIVFSPGFGGSNDSYVGLSSYWASQGFVVVRVAHADAGRKLAENQDFWQTQTETDRRNRVRDLMFVLDSLDQLEKSYPELQGKIDRTKIVVAGHSYGAYTALLAGGMKLFPGGTSYADPRVKAIVAMSPQGIAANRGLTSDSWKDLRVPTMFMTGTRDFGANENEGPDWRRTAYENAAAGDKFFVLIRGANHMTFTGVASGLGEQFDVNRSQPPMVDPRTGQEIYPSTQQSTRGPALVDRGTFASIRSISLMFWDSYLKDKKDAKELLDPAKYAGSVEVSRK